MTYGHVQKMKRASQHLETVEMLTQEWVKGKRVTHDLDPNTDEQVVRLFLPHPPDTFDGCISDYFHATRSALDNLAFALALAHSKAQFDAKRQSRSEFPIFSDRAPTSREIEDKIGCIHPDARTVILELQPHGSPDNWWLQAIHDMNRFDKHRIGYVATLDRTGFGIGNSKFSDRIYIETMSVQTVESPDGHTELGRYRGWHEICGQRYMRVPISIEIDPVFKDGPIARRPVTTTLSEISDHVQSQILEPLSRYL